MTSELVVVMLDNGRKDHLGPPSCGPGTRTLCGKPLYPHGYPTGQQVALTEPYFCKRCARSA